MAKRYEVVLNDILDKISQGVYKSGDKLPTESSMLTYYNVSRITVQKAMNILVSRGLLERTPGRGTFVKDLSKTHITGGHNNFYAIITPFQEPETLKIIKSAQDVMSENGQYLTVHITDYKSDDERSIINKLIEDGVSGIIVYAMFSDVNQGYYASVARSHLPLVFIDKSVNGLTANLVLSDNQDGAYQATEYLIKNGHRQIAYISYSFTWGTSLKERVQGFKQCMTDHHIPVIEDAIAVDMYDKNAVSSRLDAIMEKHPDITAIQCGNDHIAKYAYRWAHSRGKRIPEDISIVGFDNDSFTSSMNPPMTTISQDFSLIGKEAAQLILDVSRNGSKLKQIIYTPVKLVERNSVMDISADSE